jgi:hypothetical protein
VSFVVVYLALFPFSLSVSTVSLKANSKGEKAGWKLLKREKWGWTYSNYFQRIVI